MEDELHGGPGPSQESEDDKLSWQNRRNDAGDRVTGSGSSTLDLGSGPNSADSKSEQNEAMSHESGPSREAPENNIISPVSGLNLEDSEHNDASLGSRVNAEEFGYNITSTSPSSGLNGDDSGHDNAHPGSELNGEDLGNNATSPSSGNNGEEPGHNVATPGSGLNEEDLGRNDDSPSSRINREDAGNNVTNPSSGLNRDVLRNNVTSPSSGINGEDSGHNNATPGSGLNGEESGRNDASPSSELNVEDSGNKVTSLRCGLNGKDSVHNRSDSGFNLENSGHKDASPSSGSNREDSNVSPNVGLNGEDFGNNFMSPISGLSGEDSGHNDASPSSGLKTSSSAVPNSVDTESGHKAAGLGSEPIGVDSRSRPNDTHLRFVPSGVNTKTALKNASSGSGTNDADPTAEQSAGPSGLYRPPPMRAQQKKQNEAAFELLDVSIPTVPTFEQYILQQHKDNKNKETVKNPLFRQNTSQSNTFYQRSNCNRNDRPPRKHQQNTYARQMTCGILAEISKSESVIIIEKINRQKESFKKLLEATPDKWNQDVFALVFELIANVWRSSFDESKKLLLLEICNSKFIDHLQLYLMQLPYIDNRDKSFNRHYWTKENEFWSNFMNFCECIINVSPSTAVRKCGALIEATSKSCLDGLKEKHKYELPAEYTTRMTKIRDSLRKQEQTQKKSNTSSLEPPESFRQLSVLPTAEELLSERAFVRPNVVEGGYADVEHYLDVQFRLLREDCFGPLREGIHQYIQDPKKRKYDNIRVYRNVKFLEPYFTKLQVGSLVLLDRYTEKIFKRINWTQSKRFLFGSLVLFTKDNCRSFLVGTILERDEKYLSQRLLGVSIIDSTLESDLYNDDLYTMIECEVYFEPYHHVLKALQDPSFAEQLAMSYYIVHVQKVPESPAYLTPHTVYAVNTNEGIEVEFTVLQDKTWPTQTQLGLDSTQYEAYKLALAHEFAVIQGPPGTGKTFLGVKIARTLLENAPFRRNICSMLVICYTNHALDQFLEALLPITDSIARVGGRSQSQLLEKHNLSNLRSRHSFYEKFRLQECIQELKNTREACVSSEILLSCNTIVAFVEECKIIELFYKYEFTGDALKYWLFEDVEGVEFFEPFLGEHVQNGVNVSEEVHKNKDVDDDIFAREKLVLDDNIDEDLRIHLLFTESCISFSLPEAEDELNKRIKLYHGYKSTQQSEEVEDLNNIDQLLQDLESKIFKLHSEIKVFKEMMTNQTRAPRIKLADVKDLSTVPRIERWSLYFKWARITKAHLKKKVKQMEKRVHLAAEAYEEARMIADLEVLSRTRVIGMTTSAAARLRKMLVAIAPPLVVVEEAAEVLEAHIVTALTKNCQHLILIGDHQQLRPSAACVRLARHFGLEVSLFERMVRNGVRSVRLGVQHRMRPELAALVAPHIYPDLRNHPSVEDFPPVRGVAHNLFFFSHNYMEEIEDDNNTRTNTQEADFTLRLANYLMQQGYKPDEVTILATYSGQMFYMRRQRSFYDHLADVKITVLDNYQGEESKIILLSLVRNNTNDSIGFLGTENRVCVALSRAREGFFIFGNIDLLKRNSTLWNNIAQTLASNGSLGSSLKLKCENHTDQITTISSLEDFGKVPEGGCLLDCGYKIPSCGHPCPRMCHSYDLAHAKIECTRDCERKICEIEGHNCPSNCGTKCRPCQRIMQKSLPCGHTRAALCYMAPDDPSIYCTVPITVTLPGCGHEATKQCSMKISDVKCMENCENNRLSCGHACIWKCHINYDPDHETYTCPKPCPKAKKGCTATLDGDLGDHKCPLLCNENCVNCDVQVTKKRSGCKHSKRVACHEDVDSEPCREKCARSLPCRHHCKKLCFEPCGDCQQKVKKTIPDCNHEIQIECGTDATREHCREKCERTMACGHVCPARCDKPCDQTKCEEVTEHSCETPCGHNVKLPCHVYQAMQTGAVVTETLLTLCSAPCGALLLCGHTCSGSCAGCHQGRLHAPCTARCHQLNICGHRCEEPCSQVCPPCRRRCEVRCPHSRCGRLCGAPCTPCAEECSRACRHSRCTRACGAACSRAPCDAACARRLRCGHACRGLCGEPCPPVCRLCRPDDFPTDLLGDPYGDDDKLIQLQDCPHILDVDTLDSLMKSENDTIQIKTCPFCRVPIINTYRYKDLVNKMLKNDINPIKEKVYGSVQQRSKMRLELLKKIKEAGVTQHLTRENKYWNTAYNAIQNAALQKNKGISVLQLDMYHIFVDLLVSVGEYYLKYVSQHLTELKTEMQTQIKLICEALFGCKQKISQQQQSDIGNELKRMNSIVQLSKMLEYNKLAKKSELEEAAKAAIEAVLAWHVYDEEKAVECLKKLEDVAKLSGTVTKVERMMVVRAIGLKAGHWYKCSNGHFYCIADCGGAMVVSQCPDCKAPVGGRNHALTAGNRHAPEMDGSRFAAWSTEANNMANFRFD